MIDSVLLNHQVKQLVTLGSWREEALVLTVNRSRGLREGTVLGQTCAPSPKSIKELRAWTTAFLCFLGSLPHTCIPSAALGQCWRRVANLDELGCTKRAASVQLAGGFAHDSDMLVAHLQSRAVHPHRLVSADTDIGGRKDHCVCHVVQSFTQPREPSWALHTERAFPRKNRTGKTQ